MSTVKREIDAKANRRSKRPFVRIPVEVRGTDASGREFTESTHTVGVNRNGGRISLKATVLAGARVTITNLARKESCAFRVVERTSTRFGEHAEWGVECLESGRNFWGISFPEAAQDSHLDEGIDVMIECAGCHSRELAQLTIEQYHRLSANSALERDCVRCGKRTPWEFGFAEVLLEESLARAPSSVLAALPDGKDRRHTKRYVAMLPMRLRNRSGEIETTRTENLSTLGLCFISGMVIAPGAKVFLSVGPPEGDKKELPARVAWCRPITGSNRSLIGVRLDLGENP